MKKSDINPMPEYWDRYINLVADVELSQAFDDSIQQLDQLDRIALARIGDLSYAPGKWSVKDILQHLIDGERVMTYRALTFARRDDTTLPGFDQDLFVANAGANSRTVNSLIDELLAVRRATKAMYDSFDDETLKARGVGWQYETSVLELGFAIVGHQIHHFNVIAEKYSSLEGTEQG
ncbi:MAG TPA: DinB family protein [Pyrinomonadaceae bacterium]|nr:DinB family protein [Pyrinomonadaceae bacterium]